MQSSSESVSAPEAFQCPSAPATSLTDSWTVRAMLIVIFCFILNMADGIDILSMSFSAPAIMHDWAVPASTMGYVFSAALVGMAFGGVCLAPLSDTVGRRAVILGALLTMCVSMFAAGLSNTLLELLIARIGVGVGIGSILATIAALTNDVAPQKHKSFAICAIQAGYPLAAAISGFAYAGLLPLLGWHRLLMGSGVVTFALIPVALLVVPHSISQGVAANASSLPRIASLFENKTLRSSLLLWASVILYMMNLYFVISWIPKLAMEAGVTNNAGIIAGSLYNLGACVGNILVGILSIRINLRRLMIAYSCAAAAALITFGTVHMDPGGIFVTTWCIGMFVQGGMNAHFPLAAEIYPAGSLSTAVGWMTGIGRAGAIFGPILGGTFLTLNMSLPNIFTFFAATLLISGICIQMINAPRTQH